jgi:calmodulin
MSPAQLKAALEEVFLDHDGDCNGVLDQAEFSRCISELGGRLNLDKVVVRDIFRAIDVNGDGVVEWKEFVGPAIHIIMGSITADAQAEEAEAAAEAEAALKQQAADLLLNGTSQEELEASLTAMFQAADFDNSGTISPQELYQLVSGMDWNLQDQEINYLLYELDTNGDGQIDIAEFIPVAFEMLVDMLVTMHKFEAAAEAEAKAVGIN